MADGSGAEGAVAEGAATTGADAGAAAAAQAGATGASPGAGTAALNAAPPPPWHGALDEESIGWLQTKGWYGTDIGKADVGKGFPEMVKSYRSMESVLGRSRIAVPKDINDKEGWDAYYSAGGRPADWKGYDLKAGEGGDQTHLDTFAEIMHSEGLSTRQAHSLYQKVEERAKAISAARQAESEQAYANTSTADLEGLRKEWAGQADAKFGAAQRAKVASGLDDAVIDKIERAIGTKAMIGMFSVFGEAISEDRGAGGGSQPGVVTPQQASARLAEMRGDKQWMAEYMAGDAEKVAEFNKMVEIKAKAMR